jgi:predicted SprT family Zn-dependent metalloprotease
MAKARRITHPSQVQISDRVTFSYQGRDWEGTIAKKGSQHAYIVCENQQEFRVPYQRLQKIVGTATHPVQTANERRRAQFNTGDRVSFQSAETLRYGVIARLNPSTGHVVCEDGKEYRVSYGLLQHLPETCAPTHGVRSQAELAHIADQARALLAHHQLSQWSFQFDTGTRRAGACHFTTQLISLSHEFAKRAPEEEIRDTILHEIAHALVGKEHNHDQVWQTQACRIGCSGQRCHNVQFAPPRYIMKCVRGCWVATAERRRRNLICKQCGGKLEYLTYTEERWQSEKAQSKT